MSDVSSQDIEALTRAVSSSARGLEEGTKILAQINATLEQILGAIQNMGGGPNVRRVGP